MKNSMLVAHFQYPKAEYINITFFLQESPKDGKFYEISKKDIFHAQILEFEDGSISFPSSLLLRNYEYKIKYEVSKQGFLKVENEFSQIYEINFEFPSKFSF